MGLVNITYLQTVRKSPSDSINMIYVDGHNL